MPNACVQPYHPGRGSHGQLFRPQIGAYQSSAWHSRRTSVRTNNNKVIIKFSLCVIHVL